MPEAAIGFAKFIHKQDFNIVVDGGFDGARGEVGASGNENAVHLPERDFEGLVLILEEEQSPCFRRKAP